jgi:hypothetical protein
MNELFFQDLREFKSWVEKHPISDLVNNGMSDHYEGYNEYQCSCDNDRITLNIDSAACIAGY